MQDDPQTTVLVTGGCGFVMSNVITNLLAAYPDAKVVSLDINPTDRLTQEFFRPFSDRITHIQADVREPSSFSLIPTDRPTPIRIPHSWKCPDILLWAQGNATLCSQRDRFRSLANNIQSLLCMDRM